MTTHERWALWFSSVALLAMLLGAAGWSLWQHSPGVRRVAARWVADCRATPETFPGSHRIANAPRPFLAGLLPASMVSGTGVQNGDKVDYIAQGYKAPPRGYHAVMWEGRRYFLPDAPPGYREVLTDTGAYYVPVEVPAGVIEVGAADPVKVIGEVP